jgi:hypothetical protein
VNVTDFYDWKRHPVTQVVMDQLTNRVAFLKETLSEQAGKDPLTDRFHAGYIAGLKELLLIEYEEEEQE